MSDITVLALPVPLADPFFRLYKGIYPLWGRQIPYTMMKFASFETIVEMMYHRLPGQKSDYSKSNPSTRNACGQSVVYSTV